MPDLSGMSPITIKLTDTLLQLASRIRPGQSLQATVSGNAQQPFVQISNQRVPIPAGANVAVGDTVTVQVQQGPEGPRIVISPLTGQNPAPNLVTANLAASTLAGRTNLDALTALLQQLTQGFPELRSLNAQQQAALVPSKLPAMELIVRLALETLQLQQSGAVTQARETVLAALNALASRGNATELTSQVAMLLGADVDATDARALEQMVRLLGEQALRSPLATLQSAVVTGASTLRDAETAGLYHLLSLLRNDAQVLQLLSSQQDVQNFQGAADTLRDHLAGQALQNARAFDMPYHFLSLPMGDGFQRAQVHFFGDGQGQGGSNHENGTLILDLELSNLGSLWLEMQHRGDACSCQFYVESEEVAEVIRTASDDLVERLSSTPFSQVTIHASADAGERSAALAKVLQPLSGLDLRA